MASAEIHRPRLWQENLYTNTEHQQQSAQMLFSRRRYHQGLFAERRVAADIRYNGTWWRRSVNLSIHQWQWRLCADRWPLQRQTTSDERAGRVQCSTVTAASITTKQRCAVQQSAVCDVRRRNGNLQVLRLNSFSQQPQHRRTSTGIITWEVRNRN